MRVSRFIRGVLFIWHCRSSSDIHLFCYVTDYQCDRQTDGQTGHCMPAFVCKAFRGNNSWHIALNGWYATFVKGSEVSHGGIGMYDLTVPIVLVPKSVHVHCQIQGQSFGPHGQHGEWTYNGVLSKGRAPSEVQGPVRGQGGFCSWRWTFFGIIATSGVGKFCREICFCKRKTEKPSNVWGMAPPGSAIKSVLSSQYPIDETEPQHRRRQISSDHFVSR